MARYVAGRLKVYLAGPDVFLDSAIEQGERKKALCAQRNLDGFSPFDNEITSALDDTSIDRMIYRANVAMMERCDCAVFNLSAFRGPGVDDGTAFELGYLTALRKPCFGYVNDPLTLRQRTEQLGPLHYDEVARRWRAADGHFVEDFGNAHNLMIDNAIREHRHEIVRAPDSRPLSDLAAFETCLEQILIHYDLTEGGF